MSPRTRRAGAVGLIALGLAASTSAPGSARAAPDDWVVGYEALYIPEVRLGSATMPTRFLRHSLVAELGFGELGVGLRFQEAAGLDDAIARGLGVRSERGVMLTGRWDHVLTDFLRLETKGQLGLTHSISDPSQALFATETDLHLDLVAFDAVGLGPPGSAVFLSGHLGASLNWVGRAQMITGAGAWWRQLGVYATLLWSLNGVADPMDPPPDEAALWARLDDAGVSFALSWDLDLGLDETIRLEVRQNIPIRNGGFDFTFGLRWMVPLFDVAPAAPSAW